MQEPPHAQSYPTETGFDFASISTELFQPEEIFQLDQPLRPEYQTTTDSVARSPPTLLDLGSGTIHREFKSSDYWNQLMNDDNSNNSSCSRFNLTSSPDSSQMLNNNMIPPNQGLNVCKDENLPPFGYNLQRYEELTQHSLYLSTIFLLFALQAFNPTLKVLEN